MKKLGLGLVILALCLGSHGVLASDHADPAIGGEEATQEPNITGLFVFPDGENMIVIFNVYRSLLVDGPYKLEEYEYNLFFDLHSAVSYTDPAVVARYGGEVEDSTGISADITIKIALNNDATWKGATYTGLSDAGIRTWAGVRDDPFIFPRFFGKNVISMVLSIPFSSFPEGQQDWVVWGTTNRVKDGEQIDHVGRSGRTQAPRFALFLNTVHPSEHVATIEKWQKKDNKVSKLIMSLVSSFADLFNYTLNIRDYDLQPDVLIFTTRTEPGFPNGRRLEDDIAAITCAFGDCILQELSYIEGKDFPRRTTNDRQFSPDFPYLGVQWPSQEPEDDGFPWLKILIVILLLILVIWFIRWWLNKRHLKHHPHGDSGEKEDKW